MLLGYLAKLRAQFPEGTSKAGQLSQREKARRVPPLPDQITELMQSLPPQLRDRPWAMQELVPRLSGRWRDHPHPQQIAAALRGLSWRSERRYGKGYGSAGTRIWVAPSGAGKLT